MRTRHYWLGFAENAKSYTKKQLINVMFDDSEKQTCENCAHKYVVDSMTTECRCNDCPIDWLDLECFNEFSCKFHEVIK